MKTEFIRPRLYSLHDVATLLSCSVQTVRRLVESGKLRAIDLNAGLETDDGEMKRTLRIPTEAIDDLINGNFHAKRGRPRK